MVPKRKQPRQVILGEEQKKLDALSNEVFVKALVSTGKTVLCCFRPVGHLDGSSNIDCGVSIGTIAYYTGRELQAAFIWLLGTGCIRP
ncbi:putative fructose-bisphosphatase [Helianthus annuus]|nr:putative fructose-bisphosphatase [Helianthus annuus]KAJ0777286.1 putative fructose-bisphosphatase [Helianthus annuus]KAJ0940006.1 putative fructose-bisphosphatase [Helianthus annuus]KAJ0951872.1 putative fructose-bisphosphatase [Helianthus annuus]